MKRSFFICALVLALGTICALSCRKSTVKKQAAIDPERIYKGEIIAGDCPSFAFIKVIGDEIGDNWTFDKSYTNVIGITNCPDSLMKGDIISFRIKTSAKPLDCVIEKPCLMVSVVPKYPEKLFCASDIARVK